MQHDDDRLIIAGDDVRRRHALVRVLVAFLGFFLFAVRAVLQAWLLDATPPRLGGSAIGVLFAIQAFGAAIGPICAGVLADRYGIMAAFYFLAGTIIVANMMIFFTPSGVTKNT